MKSLFRLSLTQFVAPALILIGCSKHAAAPTFDVEAMFPTSGPDSTQVSIGGTGFSATPSDNIVSFNGKIAAVLSATATGLVVRTPTLAGTGNVTVTVGGKTMNAGVFTYDTTWMASTISDTITAPEYLSIDDSGNLYVSSFLNSVIYKVSPTDSISTFAHIAYPLGSAFDANGNLYAISDGEYIYKIRPNGIATLFASDTGYMVGLAVGGDGNIYVANQNTNAIDMITPQGVVSVYDSSASFCSGLIEHKGTLYTVATDRPGITGSGVGVITNVTGPESAISITSGFDYDGEAQLAFDNSNNLYVTDFNQGNLQGSVLRVAPDGTSSYLQMPDIPFIVGIVSDPSGHLYVTGFQSSQYNFTGYLVKLTMH